MSEPASQNGLAEDEIDLREAVKVLVRYKWLILGLGILAALVAATYSLAQSKTTYEATALLAVTRTQYQMNFDPRLTTNRAQDVPTLSKALITLSTSDDVASAVLSTASGTLPSDVKTADSLRGMLQPKATSDPSLVALKVRAGDPVQAAAIANTWADLLTTHARKIYEQSDSDTTFFEARLGQTDQVLAKAESALADFQTRNDLSVISNTLKVLQQEQQSYLAERENIARLTNDIQGFRNRISAIPSGAPITPADDLTALLLELRAFNAQAVTPDQTGGTNQPSSIQLQVGGRDAFSGKNAGELLAFLEGLSLDLKTKSSTIGKRVDEITPQILTLQGQLQLRRMELDRLTTARDVAKETYLTVARKNEEARLANQSTEGQITVASKALPPTTAMGRGTTKNAALGGALGLIVGVVCAFALEWWRSGKVTEKSPEETSSARPALKVGGSNP